MLIKDLTLEQIEKIKQDKRATKKCEACGTTKYELNFTSDLSYLCFKCFIWGSKVSNNIGYKTESLIIKSLEDIREIEF